MHLLTIKHEHIEQLNEVQLTELLEMLLCAEARTKPADIHVTTNVKVGDGGIDGRWDSDFTKAPYIPAKHTIYQCKAEEISPKKCYSEIYPLRGSGKAKKRVLSDAAKEALKTDSCYVFFCKYQFNGRLIASRLKEANQALADSSSAKVPKDRIHFLDGSKIARWVNTDASAISYVSRICNLPCSSELKDLKWCLESKEHSGRYIENNYLTELKETLRKEISVENNIVRLQGLSGLGKTRLILEALKGGDGSDFNIPSAYIDISGSGSPRHAINVVEALVKTSASGVLVADNCSKDHHESLCDLVQRVSSKISLVTADFHSDEVRSQVKYLQIENQRLRDIIPAILKETKDGRKLSDEACNQISRFCDGFPQIAILMASMDGGIPEMRHLNETQIAQKLLWGGNEEKADQLKVLRVLSLFRHIDSPAQTSNQIDFIRSSLLDGISAEGLRELTTTFIRRKIIQRIGNYIAVSPRPIAVALAAEWWEFTDKEKILSLLPGLVKVDLMDHFCARIEDLDFSDNATSIIEGIYKELSPLSNAEELSSATGSRLFRAFSHVNPASTLRALKSSLSKFTIEDYSKIDSGRRNILWALERMVWDADLFDDAASLLFHFAAGENEHYANNATGMLKQLYQWSLAGTEVPALERLPVVDEMIATGSKQLTELSIQVLGEALRRGSFTRTLGSEKSVSKLPKKDWEPRHWGEVFEYWEACFERLEGIALGNIPELDVLARDEIGRHLRTFLLSPLCEELEPRIQTISNKWNYYWPVALDVVRGEIHYATRQPQSADIEKLKREGKKVPHDLEKLRRWEGFFSPKDLKSRIELLVSNAPIDDSIDENGNLINNAMVRAEKLAEELHDTGEAWWVHLPLVFNDSQKQAVSLGVKLGELSREMPETQLSLFLDKCFKALLEVDAKSRNPDFLGGFLCGFESLETTQQTLDRVSDDTELAPLLARLSVLSGENAKSIQRVVTAVQKDRIPSCDLKMLAYGSYTKNLEPKELEQLLNPLIYNDSSSLGAVHSILHMYCFGTPEKKPALAHVFQNLLSCHGSLPSDQETMDAYYWEEDVSVLLEENNPVFARKLAKLLLDEISDSKSYFESRHSFPPILSLLFQKYPSEVWPLFEYTIEAADKGTRFRLITAIGKTISMRGQTCPLLFLPKDVLHGWIKANPDLVNLVLHHVSLFQKEDTQIEWHPAVPGLLELFSEISIEVYSALNANFFSFGSSGSRVPYLERRKVLLEELLKRKSVKLRKIAKKIIKNLDQEIDEEKRHDEEYSHGIF